MIQRNFVNMESMLSLFDVCSDIQDLPNAKEIYINEGPTIKFGI